MIIRFKRKLLALSFICPNGFLKIDFERFFTKKAKIGLKITKSFILQNQRYIQSKSPKKQIKARISWLFSVIWLRNQYFGVFDLILLMNDRIW